MAKMSDARQRLLEKKKKLEEQLAALDRREAEQKRKDDRKRAELAGRAVLSYAKTDPQFAATLRDVLDASISTRRERELLDLGEEPSEPARARPEIRVALRQAGEQR